MNERMQAIVHERYGPPAVLRLASGPEPERRSGWSRVRVHAAALNPKDVLLRKGKMRWLPAGSLPRVPGYDVAGELLDPAPGLAVGDPVFGMIQSNGGGAYAEVAALRHDWLAPKPEGLSMAEAASLPLAGQTALQALRDELGVRSGQHVLLNGASGGVGTLAVQVAKALGARVSAVCSGRNAALVTDLGADRVLDYTESDPSDERGLDHVFDIYGNLPWEKAEGMLRSGGRYCTTVPRPGSIARGALRRLGLHRAALVVVKSRRADLEQLRAWVEGKALRPVVDRTLPWTDVVEAHEYLETRRARGKVVLDIAG